MAKSNLKPQKSFLRENGGFFFGLLAAFLLLLTYLLATAPGARAGDLTLHYQRGCAIVGNCPNAPDSLEYRTRNGLYTPVGNGAEIFGDALVHGADVWLQNKREKRLLEFWREQNQGQKHQRRQKVYRQYEDDNDNGGGYGEAANGNTNDENWVAVNNWPRKCNGRVYRDYRWVPDGLNRRVVSDACVLGNNRVHAFADPDTGQIYKWQPQ